MKKIHARQLTPKNIRARAYGYNTKITENAAKIKIL